MRDRRPTSGGPEQKPSGRPPEPRGPRQAEQPQRFRFPLWYLLAAVALVLLILWAAEQRAYQEIGTGRFRQLLIDDKVATVELYSGEARGELKAPLTPGGGTKFVTNLAENDDELVPLLQEKLGENWSRQTSWLEQPWVFWVLPIVVLIVLWRFLLGRVNPVSSVMDFSQSRAAVVAQKEVGISFDDVAGIEECKQELQEVVEFLRNPSKFTRLGGRIPKGVLLVGPPGTGKTLLAKAVAGEAGVTFFSLSGSDFVEMFVGVGAARVRDLFEQAQRSAPCIIFIDELDALGKARGVGLMGGHDEREQTLNALLVQMDGFKTQKGIILLAATNRPEMLDPALLRPGRFDRHVVVPPPDLQDRRAILDVHTRAVKLDDEVDLRKLAAMTPGFVGADLANLVNEASLLAARRDKDHVTMAEFEDSIERVVGGLEKRNRLMNDQEKETVAYHESGHALVACVLPGADPVRKVSMIPRGAAALGYTMQMPTEDRYLLKKSELIDRLTVMLGGRSAEEIVFGEVSTGAHNDLQKATELAREMVTEFGMSEQVGPLSYSRRNASFGAPDLQFNKPWSERTGRQIDEAVRELVETARRRAVDLLREHRDALDATASALRETEVIEEARLREILDEHHVPIRGPKEPREEENEEEQPAEAEVEPRAVATKADPEASAQDDPIPDT